MIGAILSHLDFLDEQISRLSEAIEAQLGPFAAGVELARSLTGVARRTAEVMVAEIGVDMTVFPTAGHLASWAGRCPGNDQSAVKRRSGRTRKGSKWLGIALEEAALAATRTKNTNDRRVLVKLLMRRSRPGLRPLQDALWARMQALPHVRPGRSVIAGNVRATGLLSAQPSCGTRFRPVVLAGLSDTSLVMIYGPRDPSELETVFRFVQLSHAYATGSA